MSFTHVFVSYIRENAEQVDRLTSRLREAGIEVWIDREQILPGYRWQTAIREAIETGSFFIACFSHEYETRDRNYMNEELAIAVEELRKRSIRTSWFIPVRLSECDVPPVPIGGGQTLRELQWVDLYREWDGGIKRIIEVLRAPKGATAGHPAAGPLPRRDAHPSLPIYKPVVFGQLGLRFQGQRRTGLKITSWDILKWMNASDVLDAWCEHADDASFDVHGVVLGDRWDSAETFVVALKEFLRERHPDIELESVWTDSRYPGRDDLRLP